MEANKIQTKSIWGKWWDPIRKWFYPSWLIYETSVRFYDYALIVHSYFNNQQDKIASYIGEIATEFLDIFCSVTTFTVCSAFLTVPACIALYKFFNENKLTATQFEQRIKTYF